MIFAAFFSDIIDEFDNLQSKNRSFFFPPKFTTRNGTCLHCITQFKHRLLLIFHFPFHIFSLFSNFGSNLFILFTVMIFLNHFKVQIYIHILSNGPYIYWCVFYQDDVHLKEKIANIIFHHFTFE